MKVAITGGTGLVGTALQSTLADRGDEAVVVSRSRERGDLEWDPKQPGSLTLPEDVTHVVHLAGESLYGNRWTPEVKEEILESRVLGTTTVAQAVRDHGGIEGLVSASAVGYYGDRGEEVLTEESAPGSDFLARVCVAWEDAVLPVAKDDTLDTSVARVRSAVVLSERDGALPLMLNPIGPLKPYHWGVGGPIGRGRAWFPWVHEEDEARAVLHVLDEGLEGPVNLHAPQQVRNKGFTEALGDVLNRPTVIPVPKTAIRVLFGEVADVVTASQRVEPQRLEETGFTWRFPTVEEALEDLLGEDEGAGTT